MENYENVAVIDIGSTAVRMVVAEIGSDSTWRILDRAGKPVPVTRLLLHRLSAFTAKPGS